MGSEMCIRDRLQAVNATIVVVKSKGLSIFSLRQGSVGNISDIFRIVFSLCIYGTVVNSAAK